MRLDNGCGRRELRHQPKAGLVKQGRRLNRFMMGAPFDDDEAPGQFAAVTGSQLDALSVKHQCVHRAGVVVLIGRDDIFQEIEQGFGIVARWVLGDAHGLIVAQKSCNTFTSWICPIGVYPS